jgi:hypothetical protein
MAELNVVQQGERVKFIVTSQNPNFDLETCDFYVEIIYGMRRNKRTIEKSEFLYGTGGEFVMMFDTAGMIGKITARMVWQAHDTDSEPGNERQEVDEQVILFVVDTPCPKFFSCPSCSGEGRDVRYELTEESDIAAMFMRLCSTDAIIPDHGEPYIVNRPFVSKNDEYLYVRREILENND